jgi:hypothetical protein
MKQLGLFRLHQCFFAPRQNTPNASNLQVFMQGPGVCNTGSTIRGAAHMVCAINTNSCLSIRNSSLGESFVHTGIFTTHYWIDKNTDNSIGIGVISPHCIEFDADFSSIYGCACYHSTGSIQYNMTPPTMVDNASAAANSQLSMLQGPRREETGMTIETGHEVKCEMNFIDGVIRWYRSTGSNTAEPFATSPPAQFELVKLVALPPALYSASQGADTTMIGLKPAILLKPRSCAVIRVLRTTWVGESYVPRH